MPAPVRLELHRGGHTADAIENGAMTLKAQQSARARVYLRLAEAFRLPGAELPKCIAELETALSLLDSEASKTAAALRRYCTIDPKVLQRDHTALFIGPFLAPAPPYGSVYLENKRRLMSDSTAAARDHYLRRGLDLRADFREAPDHICAELEFMYVLVGQSCLAIDGRDGELLAESLRQQRSFLSCHLGAWIGLFATRVGAHARTEFYRLLARTTAVFIAEEIEALPEV